MGSSSSAVQDTIRNLFFETISVSLDSTISSEALNNAYTLYDGALNKLLIIITIIVAIKFIWDKKELGRLKKDLLEEIKQKEDKLNEIIDQANKNILKTQEDYIFTHISLGDNLFRIRKIEESFSYYFHALNFLLTFNKFSNNSTLIILSILNGIRNTWKSFACSGEHAAQGALVKLKKSIENMRIDPNIAEIFQNQINEIIKNMSTDETQIKRSSYKTSTTTTHIKEIENIPDSLSDTTIEESDSTIEHNTSRESTDDTTIEESDSAIEHDTNGESTDDTTIVESNTAVGHDTNGEASYDTTIVESDSAIEHDTNGESTDDTTIVENNTAVGHDTNGEASDDTTIVESKSAVEHDRNQKSTDGSTIEGN